MFLQKSDNLVIVFAIKARHLSLVSNNTSIAQDAKFITDKLGDLNDFSASLTVKPNKTLQSILLLRIDNNGFTVFYCYYNKVHAANRTR